MDLEHEGKMTVKQRYYNKIFSLHYNIGFRPVKTDQCNTCRRLEIAIQDGRAVQRNVDHLILEYNEHKAKANVAYSLMKDAKIPDADWAIICMDLEQTWPCPKLSVGSAYYKRKLWLYNFCVHDIPKNESYMYIWEENVAARGSIEIASCLIKWIDDFILKSHNSPRNL